MVAGTVAHLVGLMAVDSVDWKVVEKAVERVEQKAGGMVVRSDKRTVYSKVVWLVVRTVNCLVLPMAA